MKKAKIDEVGKNGTVQQIDGPSLPTKLTSPKRLLSVTMALFFSFLHPYSLSILRNKVISYLLLIS